MHKRLPISKRYKKAIFVALFLLASFIIIPVSVQAAPLSNAALRFDRMKSSTNNINILVVAKPNATATDTRLKVALNTTNYTVNDTAANITVTTSGVTSETIGASTVCTAMPGMTGAATTVSGGTMEFVITNLTTTTTYCFYISGGVGSTSSTGVDIANTLELLNDAVSNELSSVGTSVISNDQVVITAVVPPTFTFTLSGNTDAFIGNLSTSTTSSTTGITVTASTNAQSGWEAWLKSSNGALTSAVTGASIPTSGTIGAAAFNLATGTSAYAVAVRTGTGSPTMDPSYNDASNQNRGGTPSSTAYRRIAYNTTPASGNTFTVYGRAAISATQQAATDYTDTWTIVGAGIF